MNTIKYLRIQDRLKNPQINEAHRKTWTTCLDHVLGQWINGCHLEICSKNCEIGYRTVIRGTRNAQQYNFSSSLPHPYPDPHSKLQRPFNWYLLFKYHQWYETLKIYHMAVFLVYIKTIVFVFVLLLMFFFWGGGGVGVLFFLGGGG